MAGFLQAVACIASRCHRAVVPSERLLPSSPTTGTEADRPTGTTHTHLVLDVVASAAAQSHRRWCHCSRTALPEDCLGSSFFACTLKNFGKFLEK